VDCLSFDEAAAEICRRIEQRIPTHVVYINAAKVVKYHRNPVLRSVIERADLLLADGVPVVWISRLFGRALPGRVNGTDLMEHMVAHAAERGYGIFLLGGTEEVVYATAAELRRRHPRLKMVGVRNGYFKPEQNDEVLQAINDSGADLLLIGISTPQKELWGDHNLARLRVPVCQGVGGSFDVVVGLVSRAPRWMQRCGLEWFYRFLQEPRRMGGRYLRTNPEFLWLVLRETARLWSMRLARRFQ
jgi:N-acetylglucosaminyldiphosphoundecaprenol N-acetyl-beta-D-mannosaminyltransferase